MNICFNIGTLSYSGAEKIMYHMIKEFLARGDSVSIILMSRDKPCDGIEGVKQYPIYGLYAKKKNKVVRTLKSHKCLREIIRANKFDVVLSFGVIFNVDIAEACRWEKTKLVLCERNDPLYDPHSKLLRLRRKISYKRADAFVFQTEEIKNFFPDSIRKKSVVIPNFIEQTIPVNMRYKPERPVLATAARLDDRQKDQSSMIRAFEKFYRTHREYILEFYGDGPDKTKLEALSKKLSIEDHVKFIGRVKNPMEHIRNTKAFVISSIYEGMPNSLIEAMAYGMPCISSDCSGGGARAIIKNGENGILFDVGDIDAMADAMCKVCDNSTYAGKLAKKAADINETLRMDRIIEEWRKVLQNVIYEKSQYEK